MTVRLNENQTPRGRVASYVWGPDIGSDYCEKPRGGGGVLDGRSTATGSPRASRRAEPASQYDAFGQELRSGGPASDQQPYRFSTKFTEASTGLLYYGYRWYESSKGRWINRDPIEEEGGLNLYGMVGNDPVNEIDQLGLLSKGVVGALEGRKLAVQGKNGICGTLVIQRDRGGIDTENPIAALQDGTTVPGAAWTMIARFVSNGKPCCECDETLVWQNYILKDNAPVGQKPGPDGPQVPATRPFVDNPSIPLNELVQMRGKVIELKYETKLMCTKGGQNTPIAFIKWGYWAKVW